MKTKATKPTRPLTTDLRDALKVLIQAELEQLPETLKTLDPIQRLNILMKLIPYVMPKTESVRHNIGEPEDWGFN